MMVSSFSFPGGLFFLFLIVMVTFEDVGDVTFGGRDADPVDHGVVRVLRLPVGGALGSGVVFAEAERDRVLVTAVTADGPRQVPRTDVDVQRGVVERAGRGQFAAVRPRPVGGGELRAGHDLHQPDLAFESARIAVEPAFLPDDRLDQCGVDLVAQARVTDDLVVTGRPGEIIVEPASAPPEEHGGAHRKHGDQEKEQQMGALPAPSASSVRGEDHHRRDPSGRGSVLGRVLRSEPGFPDLERFGMEPLERFLEFEFGIQRDDAQFAELFDIGFRGGVHHQVLCLLVERERDHFADVRLVGEQHDDAVHPRGDAAVRGRAELECLDHAAETLVHGFLLVSGDLERLVHDVRTVVADRAAGKFHAVADDVILIRQDVQRILGRERFHAALGHREGVVAEDDLAGLFVQLEHREVHDPAELEHVRVDQVQLGAEFGADLSADLDHFRFLVGKEEHHVAGLDVRTLTEGVELFAAHELDDRALFAVFLEDDVGHALGADALREGDHVVIEFAGLVRADAGHLDRADHAAVLHDLREGVEAAVREDVGHVDHFQRVAEIGFVRTETEHGFPVRDPHERFDFLVAELGEDVRDDLFQNGEDVFLGNETHFDVELVELARGAVRTGILVAEARGDLEIAVEAGDHQQLLELLRGLGQGIEFARMHPARHQIIARAFRRTAGQDRGLVFEETEVEHLLAHFRDDLGAEHQVFVQFFAAEVEEAVFQAQRFGGLLILGDLEREHFGLAEDLHVFRNEFDLARGEFLVDGLGGACDDRAGEADDRFDAPAFQFLIETHFRVDDDLGLAVVVAQVDEDDAAMVADAVDPAGKACLGADVLFPQGVAGVGSERMHIPFHS